MEIKHSPFKFVVMFLIFGLLILGSIFFIRINQPIKIIFIGNSLIYTNELPNILREICVSNGKNVIIEQSTAPDYKISNHVNYSKTIEKIQNTHWNYLIFNEHNFLLVNPEKIESEIIPSWDKLDYLIKENKIDNILVFGNWGFKDGIAYPGISTYKLMQNSLKKTISKLSSKYGYEYLPIGDAWEKLLEKNPDLALWVGDKIHPSFTGSYLTACVIYSSIFQESLINSKYKIEQIDNKELVEDIHKLSYEITKK